MSPILGVALSFAEPRLYKKNPRIKVNITETATFSFIGLFLRTIERPCRLMFDHCIHLIFLKVQKKESSITRCLRLMVETFWPVRVWNHFAGLKINVVRAKIWNC